LHVTQRGNYRQPVFFSDPDRLHFLELLDDEQIALDNGGTAPVAQADLRLRNAARGEYKWLNNHKPTSSCFRAAYNSEIKQWHLYDLAFTDLYRYWHTWPGTSHTVFDRGLRNYQKANDQVNHTTDLISATNC